MKKLLLVSDDSIAVIKSIHMVLGEELEIIDATSKEETLTLFDAGCPDVIFLDIDYYGEPDGWEILKEIRKKNESVVIFITTGNAAHKDNPLMNIADGFFEKPFDFELIRVLLSEKGIL